MDVVAAAQGRDFPVAEKSRAGMRADDFLEQGGIMALVAEEPRSASGTTEEE